LKRVLAVLALCAVLAGCGAMESRPETGGEEFLKMQREAQAAFDTGENARAEALYKGLLRANPNDSEAWFRLGNLYARTDNAEQAVDAYLRCLSINGNDARAWHNLGVMRLRQSWAALLRANTLTAPPEPINAISSDMLRALEKIPHLSDGPSGKPAAGAVAPPAGGAPR
jgi:cytochrome c-type biogenesis protein CcmH/NrfG